MFTYALGSGAEKTVTKNIACQNRGVFYSIPDGGDLKGISELELRAGRANVRGKIREHREL